MSRIELNDLPKYSPWPHRLLGLESWSPKKKTPEEVLREYEQEKWGFLWEKAQASDTRLTLTDLEDLLYEDLPDAFCVSGGAFELMPHRTAQQRQLDIFSRSITEFLPAPAVVELGAGYGNIILSLARSGALNSSKLFAGEFTASGVSLIKYLAESQGTDVIAGHCDFSASPVTELKIPPQSVIFTSFAIPYVPLYTEQVVNDLAALQPRVVMHFEPFHEHCDTSTLIGAMQRRYLEANDYNRNFLTILKESESKGTIKIVDERPQVFGSNPLLPFSIVSWMPVGTP